MKILFIGDYSGLHATLARCLRRRGHHVVLISDRGTFMDTDADIQLVRRDGFGDSLKYLGETFHALSRCKNFDIVQLINPNFLKLRPSKLFYIFDYLKNNNRAVCLTLAGNDYHFVKACTEGLMFRFSEFRVGDRPTRFSKENPSRETGWLSAENESYASMLYSSIDSAMAVLPEYFMAAAPFLDDRLVYTGLPVEIPSIIERTSTKDRLVTFFAGVKSGMEIQKGFDKIIPAVQRLVKRFPDKCSIKIVKDLPLTNYLEEMSRADVVLDQLYSYSPATNALQAMALGKVAASGAEPEFYDFIDESNLRPIVKLNPFVDLENTLETIITTPGIIEGLSSAGYDFVKRHNDVEIVADRFISTWKKILNNDANA